MKWNGIAFEMHFISNSFDIKLYWNAIQLHYKLMKRNQIDFLLLNQILLVLPKKFGLDFFIAFRSCKYK